LSFYYKSIEQVFIAYICNIYCVMHWSMWSIREYLANVLIQYIPNLIIRVKIIKYSWIDHRHLTISHQTSNTTLNAWIWFVCQLSYSWTRRVVWFSGWHVSMGGCLSRVSSNQSQHIVVSLSKTWSVLVAGTVCQFTKSNNLINNNG